MLSDLKLGERAKIVGVAGGDGISVRLLEMGMVPGSEVKLIGVAPLGDPLEFELRGYRLSIRRSEAARVSVIRSQAEPGNEQCENKPCER
jgi:ferrous iron transport protein A